VRICVPVLVLWAAVAHAEPIALRFAGIAPEGTSWAREARAFARQIDTATGGAVAVHLYLGGIAGDDLEMGRRMRRDQLDGVLSAGTVCQEVAPSFRVFRIPGLIQDRGEINYVLTRLLPSLQAEARAHGTVLLASASMGRDVVLSRVPIDSMATLRRLELWQWDLESVTVAYSRAMGLHIVPLPVAAAGRAYEEGRTDGFIAIPTAIFGFQWFTQRLYLAELPFSSVIGCVVMSTASFDRLAPELRAVVQDAAAKLGMRYAATTAMQDEQLLGGLFDKQGVRTTAITPGLRAEFLEAAQAARDRVGAGVVPTELLLHVQSLLADYRTEHRP
jgi:TRAP-type C4-dicarboxylate transport system substrate-binding protein